MLPEGVEAGGGGVATRRRPSKDLNKKHSESSFRVALSSKKPSPWCWLVGEGGGGSGGPRRQLSIDTLRRLRGISCMDVVRVREGRAILNRWKGLEVSTRNFLKVPDKGQYFELLDLRSKFQIFVFVRGGKQANRRALKLQAQRRR